MLNLLPASAFMVPQQHTALPKDSSREWQRGFATPRHGVSWLLCFMKATVQYLHGGLGYASTLDPPIDCTASHLAQSPRQFFRLFQICWTPAYFADFPRRAWTWNHHLSPIQYATFQFPQLPSTFGNDVTVDRIDSASLFYRQTYPGSGWEELASSNSTVHFSLTFFQSAEPFSLDQLLFFLSVFSLEKKGKHSFKEESYFCTLKPNSFPVEKQDTGGKGVV